MLVGTVGTGCSVDWEFVGYLVVGLKFGQWCCI